MTAADKDAFICKLIREASWLEWCCIAVGRRQFWRINGSMGSDFARIPEGAD